MTVELAPFHSAREQQLIDQVVGLEAGVEAIRRLPAPAPRLTHDRAGDAADVGRGHQHRVNLG